MAQMRVFVSHSHQDEAFAQRLAADLRYAGADAWIYEADESPGNIWERVDQMLAQCDWLVLVLSPDAIASSYVRTEVFVAMNRMHQGRMRGVVPIVARPIDADALPPTWGALRRFEATEGRYAAGARGVLGALGPRAGGMDEQTDAPLTAATPDSDGAMRLAPTPAPPADASILVSRLARLDFTPRTVGAVEVIVPPVCDVPAGEFQMGSDLDGDRELYDQERPRHRVTLPAYQIGRYPVTVAEYACFVRAGRRAPNNWQVQLGKLDHPVVYISWRDAVAYAAWLARLTGEPWRLPSEAEWEKAARWDPAARHARTYPWGDAFDQARCNTRWLGRSATTPVGVYAERGDAGPCGAHDMAGNVWEWTSSLFEPYPYLADDGRERPESTGKRVVRGGSSLSYPRGARAAYRGLYDPHVLYDYVGLRVACALQSS